MRKEQRQQVYDKYNGHCAYCGKKIAYKDMQIDHIKPLQRGWVYNPNNVGTDTMDNYNPSCRACNFRKGILTVEQFRSELTRQCEGIIKRSFQVRQSIDFGLLKVDLHPIVFYFEKGGEQ
jgi:hypothetical protein